MLDWYREEEAGDLRRSDVDELIETITALNAFEEKIWNSEESWKDETSYQNIVMNVKFSKNNVILTKS